MIDRLSTATIPQGNPWSMVQCSSAGTSFASSSGDWRWRAALWPWGSRKDGRRIEEPEKVELESDLPTFNIIALGAQESGKTVLLASMFHRLNTEIGEGGFRLQTALSDAVYLNDLYATLRDPGKSWPPGTLVGETRSLSFECLGSAGGAEFPVLRFNYLDYAGELVGGGHVSAAVLREREDLQRDLENRIEAAHAIFGIIDGRQMIELLRGGPGGLHYVESLSPMIGIMRKAKCPVHFILTKWDLFDGVEDFDDIDENDRLVAVRKELLAHATIRNLVEQRIRDKRIVRLIPVSAIGRRFATIDSEGRMVKRKDGRLRPINIEFPLCAVLPDLFTQIEAKLDQSIDEQIAAKSRELARLEPWEWASAVGKFLARPAGVTLRVAVGLASGSSAFSDRIADVFFDWVANPFDKKMADVVAATDAVHRRANEMRLARSEVLKEFRENMIVLSRQLPASDLTGGRVR